MLKFQPIERPIEVDEDAIPVFMSEEPDGSLLIGTINPETKERESVIKFNQNGRIVLNMTLPAIFDQGETPSIDIDYL